MPNRTSIWVFAFFYLAMTSAFAQAPEAAKKGADEISQVQSRVLGLHTPAERIQEMDLSLAKFFAAAVRGESAPAKINILFRLRGVACGSDWNACSKLGTVKAEICTAEPVLGKASYETLVRKFWDTIVPNMSTPERKDQLIQSIAQCSAASSDGQLLLSLILLNEFSQASDQVHADKLAQEMVQRGAGVPKSGFEAVHQLSEEIFRESRMNPKPVSRLKELSLLAMQWAGALKLDTQQPKATNDFVESILPIERYGEGPALEKFFTDHATLYPHLSLDTRYQVMERLCSYWEDHNKTDRCSELLKGLKSSTKDKAVLDGIEFDEAAVARSEGRLDDAKEILKPLLKPAIKPSARMWANYVMAQIESYLEHPDQARTYINEHLRMAKTQASWGGFLNASILTELKQHDEAVRAIRVVLDDVKKNNLGPTDLGGWASFVQLYLAAQGGNQKEFEKARAEAHEMQKDLPGYSFLPLFSQAVEQKFSGQSPATALAEAKALMGPKNPDLKKVERWVSALGGPAK